MFTRPRAAPSFSEKVSCIFGPLRLVIAVRFSWRHENLGSARLGKRLGARQAFPTASAVPARGSGDVPELAPVEREPGKHREISTMTRAGSNVPTSLPGVRQELAAGVVQLNLLRIRRC